jgi:hypothetical protein
VPGAQIPLLEPWIAPKLKQPRDDAKSKLEQRFTISSAVYHPKNENIRTFDAIDNHLFADGKVPRSCTEIPVTGAACMRKVCQKTESVRDGVHHSSGDIHAAALPGNIEPDIVEAGFGLWRNKVGH